jgi:hypothetical protein
MPCGHGFCTSPARHLPNTTPWLRRPRRCSPFVVIAAGALGCVLGGILGDRWGRPQAAGLAMTLSGGCALLAGFVYSGPVWLLVAVSLVWGITVVADSAQFSAMVTDMGRSPVRRHGTDAAAGPRLFPDRRRHLDPAVAGRHPPELAVGLSHSRARSSAGRRRHARRTSDQPAASATCRAWSQPARVSALAPTARLTGSGWLLRQLGIVSRRSSATAVS